MVHKFELPALPYDFNALEPVISADIMTLHYTKHHQGYVTNLNKALEQYAEAEQKNDLASMIALQQAIKFNGGGHVNHSLFWTYLAPPKQGGGGEPQGPLAKAIDTAFGSFQAFMDQLSAKATAQQGSGWAWLGYNKTTKHLEIAACDNQDPLSTKGLIPLLGIDVWEHAYYLQYKNVRPDYVKAIWQVINWANVADRFNQL
jgi:Fe-Mn family superoxide dismutase